MKLNEFAEPSIEEENKIEELSSSLYQRIQKETVKLLRSQLRKLGVNVSVVESDEKSGGYGFTKLFYPDDSKALASYEYKGVKILGVRIADNKMAIEFDVPNLETQGGSNGQKNV